MLALEQLVRAATATVAERMPPGLGERGIGVCLAAEIEALGARVDREQPAISMFVTSNNTPVVAQVGRIDFIVTYGGAVLGIELKAARTITPAHRSQAINYAYALTTPIAMVALSERAFQFEVINDSNGGPPSLILFQ
jgi:GxxExxY protein